MQNSIWKLTALAGVIGVGFLIVLQAQNGIEKSASSTSPEVTAEPNSEEATRGSQSAASLWPASSRTDSASRTPSQDSPYLSRSENASDEPFPNPARRSFDPSTSASSSTRNPIEPVEYQPERRTARRSIPVIEESADQSFPNEPFSRESSASEEKPQNVESPKAKAIRLMSQARELKDAGDLMDARNLLVEAAELPAIFGPLDERPTSMLKEVDMMLRAKTRQAKVAADDTTMELLGQLKEASTIRRTSNEELEPAKSEEASPAVDPQGDEPLVSEAKPEPKAGNRKLSVEAAEEPPRLFDDEPLDVNEEPKAKVTKNSLPTFDLNSSDSSADEPLQSLPLQEDATSTPARTRVGAAPPAAEAPKAKPALPQLPKPELTIDKSAPPDATLGQPMVYSIIVTNKGRANAAQVTVEDRIPGGCEMVGSIPQAEQSGTKLTWKLGRLAAGEAKKILVKVIPRKEGEIGSHATVNFVADVGSAPNELKQTGAEQKTTGSPLRLAVFGPEEVRIGEPIKLKFKVTNIGNRDLTEVNLQNLIPNGLQHVEGNDLTYPIGRLAAGASTTVELELKSVRAGEHTNRAILSAAGGIQSESTTSVKVLDPRGLRVEASENTSMPVGQPTTQEVRLINESSLDISGVIVTEVLPEDLRFLKATGNGVYDDVNRKVTWRLDRVPAGETAILKVTVQPKTSGPHSCLIEVTQSGQARPSSIESRVRARGVSALKLDIDHSHPTTAVGDEFTVDITLRNRGTGPDSNVSLSLVLPPEVEFVQAKSPVRNKPLEAARGGAKLLTFHPIPELGERASSDFQVLLRARSAGKAKMRAEVNSDALGESVAAESVVVVFDSAQ